ncbi:MAG: IS66 family transposase [Gammaproteobacteria bacterium]|nr:IS66 family transposase [Gammaproteobacteria bacterium]
MNSAPEKPIDKAEYDALAAENAGLRQSLREKKRLAKQVDRQSRKIDVLSAKLEWFEQQFNLERARQFAPSSEASHSLQGDLFNEAEAVAGQSDADEQSDGVEVVAHKRQKKPRAPTITDDMVKEVVMHDLDESERICSHDGSVLKPIGHESRRELVIVPEQVHAVEHRYTKYACSDCDQSIKSTPREPRITTGLCSPQAAAAVVVNKFVDHLPLYRQSERYSRHGIKIDRATLARWMIKHGQAIQPLINLSRDQLHGYPYQQLDETGQKVLKPKVRRKGKRRGAHKGYFWVQRGGPPDKPVVLYHYDGSRAGQVAKDLLAGYEGCVQTDAYGPYFRVMTTLSLSHALCHAHARRRFADAIKAIKDSKAAEHSHSMVAIKHYEALYRIEKELRQEKPTYRDLDQWHKRRLKRRQQESLPIWQELLSLADETLQTVRPTSHLGTAVGYLIKYQKQLAVYLENPLVEIDNNLVENRIRPIALGRKNWMFSDTEHGAEASGNLYSLINTAMLNGHNPYTYLVHVFKELPAAETVDEIEALLPWNLELPTVGPSGGAGKGG